MAAILWLLILAAPSARAIDPDDLLAPEEAFRLKVTARDAATVVAEWTIAEGYYLYRKRFRFASGTPGILPGEPRFPEGRIKQDQFFGEMEIYRDRVSVVIPLSRDGSAPARLELETVSQGCADIGVCYPPHEQTAAVALASAPASESNLLAARGGGTFDLFAKPEDELLAPDQAFIPTVSAPEPGILEAKWNIAQGYYLYKDKLEITLVDAEDLGIAAVEKPEGILIDDEFFGRQEVFYDQARLSAFLEGSADQDREIHVKLDYQGCAEVGVCYPPMTQTIPLTLAAFTEAPPPAQPDGFEADQDRMARMLTEQRFWALPAFFGFGLLLAFTPCVFPMIPILSSLIAGQGRSLTQRRAFLLSLTYVLAMAATYTAAGVLAAMLGRNIQATFQNPWVLITFSSLFVLLALSMFGFYELQLPGRWQSRLTELSNRQRGGSYLGVAVMGLLSALIVGPCVAPPLIGILTVIATTGDEALGGAALFTLSLGMGAPLLVIGTSAGRLLPRAGQWMNKVKAVFGVALLAVAIWMLERILPAVVAMLLWAVLLIVTATYMGALQPLAPASSWRTLVKGLGMVLLIYGILLLVGVAAGGRDPLQPLRGVSLIAADQSAQEPIDFQPVKTVNDLHQALEQARGRPVMLDFYADWCVSCKELEKYTFTHPEVQAAFADAVLLRADVTANDAADQALLRRFELMGPPALLFFDSTGRELRDYRVVGFMSAQRFKDHLAMALHP